MLAGSLLTLFAAGCINYGTSSKAVDLAQAPPGETLTYTLNVINSGDQASTSTVVTDQVNVNLEDVGNITGGGVYNPSTRTVTWNLGTVPAGGQMNLTFTADIMESTSIGTVIPNSASISYSGGGPHVSNTVQTTVIAPDPLHHFTFDPVSSPQTEGQPFAVTIYAKDAAGETISDFEEVAGLSDLTGAISPTETRNVYAALDAGSHHSLAVSSGGSLWAWGKNDQGQTGVPAGTDYVAVAGGANHSLALRSGGSLAGWGYDNHGQATPPAGTDFVAVAAGGFHGLALKADGSLAGWGENYYGQTNVPAGNDFAAISAGYYHSLALKTDGSLVAWGLNNNGQTSVPSGSDYVAISAGAYHCLALRADGSIAGWGYNEHGEATPPAGNDYAAISAGNYHSLALRTGGTLAAWGYNNYGQTTVPSGNDFTAISAGDHHCLALRSGGTIAGWGYDGYGQTDVPPGGFASGVFTGAVTIGAPYTADVITCAYDGKTGASNTFDVAALLPDLSTTCKEVDLAQVQPQGTLAYTIGVVNSGAGQATQTAVTDYLDESLENISGITGGGVYEPSEHKITWDLGTLPSQGQQELSFNAQVKAQAPAGTLITNQAQADCAETGPCATNTVQSEVIAGPVDHFAISEISTPRTAGVAFPLAITATDAFGNTAVSYAGSVNISDTTGTVAPQASGDFTSGVWSGEAVISAAAASCQVSVDDGSGHAGQSNSFEVVWDSTYPDAEITYPEEGEVLTSPSLMVTGTAYDVLLSSWQLTCRLEGESEWTPLSPPHTGPVQEGDLETWDLSGLPDGIAHLKLTVTDAGGLESSDIVGVVIERQDPAAEISWPGQGAIVGGQLQIEGTAADGNFYRYLLSYGVGESPSVFYPIPPVASDPGPSQEEASTHPAFYFSPTALDLAQTFTPDRPYLDRAEVYLTRIGESDCRIGLKVCACSGGVPTSEAIAVSETTYAMSEIDAVPGQHWYPFEFRGQYLDPSGTYALVIYRTDGQTDGDNYARWGEYGSDIYPGGGAFSYNGTSWQAGSGDFAFRAYAYEEADLYGTEEVTGGVLATWNAMETCAGPHTLRLQVEDAYGKISTGQVTVEVDRTYPTAQISSPQEGGHLRGTAEITGTATDEHFTAYQLFYGEGTGPAEIPLSPEMTTPAAGGLLYSWDTTAAADGLYTLKLAVRDQAGLVSETTVQANVDNTPPAAAITSPAPEEAACGTLFVQGTASDANFASWRLRYTQDDPEDPDALWTEIVSDTLPPGVNLGSLDTAELAETGLWLELSVSDAAGNSSVARVHVNPDNTFPDVRIDSPEEGRVYEQVHIAGVAYDSNIVSCSLYDWDGENLNLLIEEEGTGPYPEDIFTWDTTTVDDGEHVLALQASDAAGHQRTAIRIIHVDNAPPSGSIEVMGKDVAGDFTNTGFTNLKLFAEDAEYVKIWNYDPANPDYVPENAKPLLPGGGSYTGVLHCDWILDSAFFPTVEGLKEVRCQFVDISGVYSPVYSDTITLEVTPPTIGVAELENPIEGEPGIIKFSFHLSDPAPASGLERVEIWATDGGAPLEKVYEEPLSGVDYDVTATVDLTARGFGYYDFLIKAFDQAGNAAASSAYPYYYSGVPEWPMEGYDLKNTHYNAGIKPGEMFWPFAQEWEDHSTNNKMNRKTPVVSGGFLYVAESGDEKFTVLKIYTTGEQAGDRKAVFEETDPADYRIRGMCVANGKAYVVTDHSLHVLNADNLSLEGDPYFVTDYAPAGEEFTNNPVAIGDRLLLTTTTHLVCVDLENPGVQRWNRAFELPWGPSRPAVLEGMAVFTEGGRLRAVDINTGAEEDDLILDPDTTWPQWNYGGVPTIHNGIIYVKYWYGLSQSRIRIVEIQNEQLIYGGDQSENVYSSLEDDIAYANGILYCVSNHNVGCQTYLKLWAFDATTASTMWCKDYSTYQLNGGPDLGAPAVAGGLLYVGFTTVGTFDYPTTKLMVFDAYSGALRWESPYTDGELVADSPVPSAVIAGGKVYFNYVGRGTMCYEPENEVDDLNALGFDTFCGFYEGINTSLGSYTEEATDVSLPGRGIDIEFKRTYNSYKPGGTYPESAVGNGWDYSYNVYIEEVYDNGSPPAMTALKVHRGDGRVDTYTKEGDTFKPPPTVFDDLTAGRFEGMGSDPGNPDYSTPYTLKVPGGNLWEFDHVDGDPAETKRLVRIVDDYGASDNILTLDYGDDNKLDKITAPGSEGTFRCLDITWDGEHITKLEYNNQFNGQENPYLISVGYTYNSANLEHVQDIYGATTEYKYNLQDRLESIAKPENLDIHETSKTISYYAEGEANAGMVSKTEDAYGHATQFSYATPSHMTMVTDCRGYTTTHRYDTLYRLIQEVNNAGESTIYSYGDDGNGKSVRDPAGRITQFTSEQGLVKRIISPDGGVREFTYDERDRLTSETDGAGNTKYYDYDGNNNLVKVKDFDLSETLYFYDTSEPVNNPGLPTLKVMPRVNGEPGPEEDGQEPTMQYIYDAYGDLTREDLFSDWNENPAQPSGDGAQVCINFYDYTGDGRIESEELGASMPFGPGLVKYEYTYDDDVADGFRGVTKKNTSYTINVGGATLNPTEITRYDKNGNLAYTIRSRGDTSSDPQAVWLMTGYTYYKDDREWTRTVYTSGDTSNPPAGGWVQYPLYTSATKEYDTNGFLLSESDYAGRETRYFYDDAGRLVRQVDGEDRVTSYEYFADGQVKKRVDPNSTGCVTYGYDAAGRPAYEERRFTSALYGEMYYRTVKSYDTRGNVICERTTRPVPDPSLSNLNALTWREAQVNYTYDAASRVLAQASTTGESMGDITTTYEYDPAGNRLTETRTGPASPAATISFAYNAQGKTVQEAAICSYPDEAPTCVVAHRGYDMLGNVTTETICDGEGTEDAVYSHRTYDYNGLGKVEHVWAAVGEASGGFSLGTYGSIGGTTLVSDYDYFCDGLLSWETRNNTNPGGTSPSQQITYSYDPAGKKTRESWDLGSGQSYVQLHAYDGSGNLVAEASGNGTALRSTAYTYDGANRPLAKILPDAGGETTGERTISFVYSDPERKVTATDPEGRTVISTLDDLGRVEMAEIPGESLVLRAYDAGGNVIRESSRQEAGVGADTFRQAFQRFDDLGRLVEKRVLSEDGGQQLLLSTAFAYDHGGNLTSTTTPGGNTTTYAYDSLSLLRRQVLPHSGGASVVTSFTYDALGRKTHTFEGDADPDGTRYTYDGLSRLRRVEQWTDAWTGAGPGPYTVPAGGEGATTSYDVDLTGSLLSQTDAREKTTSYTYDACGRATSKTDPLGQAESFTYTAYGEADTHTYTEPEPDRTIDYDYDGRGQLTAERALDGTSEVDVINYAYDHAGNLTGAVYDRANGVDAGRTISLSYDGASRLSSVSCDAEGAAGDYSTTYGYYDSGELRSRILTSGGQTQASSNYSYDISGRLTASSDSVCGGTLTFEWSPDSLLERASLPASGGHIDYTYYAEGLTETQTAYDSSNTLQASYDYSYDDRGRRTGMTVNVPSQTALSGAYSYAYDGMGRLTGFDAPSTANDITYDYDLCGNLEQQTTGGQTKTYSYNDAGQITTGPEGAYTYDEVGNLVQKGTETFTWDGFGKLVSYKESAQAPLVTLSYDALGRLSERKVGGETERAFRYDGASLSQIQETNAAGGALATYALDPGGTHLAQDKQGTLSYLGLSPHTDVSFTLSGQGSLTGGRICDPYGNTVAGSVDSSLGYQEDYEDPLSGLVWMGARWYSPELTRFISVDPLKGETGDPLSLHPYLYCKDDPINAFDPTGMGPKEDLAQQIQAVTGALIQIQDAIHLYIRAGMEPPSYLMNTRDHLEKTLQHLYQAYRLLCMAEEVVNKAKEYGLVQDKHTSGEDPPDPAEEYLRDIIEDIQNDRDVELEGSLGAVVVAAIESDNFDEFLMRTDINVLNNMTIDQKTRFWRDVKHYFCPGHTEMTFDGKYLDLYMYLGGGRKVRLFHVDAYSGQPGGQMTQEDIGPIPRGAWRLTRRQNPETESWLPGFGDWVIRLRPAGNVGMKGSTMEWLYNQTSRSRDINDNFIQEGVFLIHEDAGAAGTSGCIGVLGNKLDRSIDAFSDLLGLGYDQNPDNWSNTYLFVDIGVGYTNPGHPGDSW